MHFTLHHNTEEYMKVLTFYIFAAKKKKTFSESRTQNHPVHRILSILQKFNDYGLVNKISKNSEIITDCID